MNTFAESIRRLASTVVIVGMFFAARSFAAEAGQLEAKPADTFFEKFAPKKAPAPGGLLLKTGDRLAICGDSITEQKMYSRIIETYLTVCTPELKISTRQYGWSVQTAEGFLGRMGNDCLRFKPTVATTCYGMNDYKYGPYDEANARWYREKYTAVARKFKDAGVRVVVGSPGCVGKVASWVKTASGTVEDHNLHLCALRNIGIEIAEREEVRFADVFWPMFTSGFESRRKLGADYAVAGKDGVHPGWAGHVLMAYVYLRSMGLDGEIGTLTVDMKANRAEATAGHTVQRFEGDELTITSQRYPFCAAGREDKDDSLRSGMALLPFNQHLNRLILIARGGSADNYRVTWASESRVYSAEQLAKGVNLAADFPTNPFSTAFSRVDEAVAAKQAYETRQVQAVFHGNEGRTDMNAAVARTEAKRTPLVKAIQDALVPVTHTLRIDPVAPAPSTQATLELRSLTSPVLLPDGTEFLTWEQRPQFSKTYYVDGQHPAASDQNPGTPDRPFATINQAAQVLQPGQRVIVAAGVYRERLRPARGGSGPEAMISYEAAPGAQVVLKGSRVFREMWVRVEADAGASV
ncbi:MAG: SGNH/GDSL hydrolase family protein, partial [Planctomycetota bacterium]|nr:SGNH/GDSL hydrolase family protein [Planctomycetota bacterium]